MRWQSPNLHAAGSASVLKAPHRYIKKAIGHATSAGGIARQSFEENNPQIKIFENDFKRL